MIKNFGRLRENKKVKRIASRLFLLMIMVMICSYFSSKKALAFIYAVAAGGSCQEWEFDTIAECAVVAFCDDLPPEENDMINAGAWSAVNCPNYSPTVLNQARSDGVVGGRQVSASSKATTISGFRNLGRVEMAIDCFHIVLQSDRTYYPENCYAIIPDGNPNTCFVGNGCNQAVCQSAGWYWNFTNNTCQSTPMNQGDCWALGYSFFNSTCYPSGCPAEAGSSLDCEQGVQIWCSRKCKCLSQTQCDPAVSPIIVDVLGDGFSLTNAADGVNFDLDGDGAAERRAWTLSGADDAWLGLDRDGDGV